MKKVTLVMLALTAVMQLPAQEQGRTLYPFKQYSREVMNRYVTDDSKGLLIAAKTPLHFDMSRETYFVLKEYQNDYCRSK